MRDIKFRAKRSDDGAWVYGDLTHVQKICSVEEKNKTGKSTMPVVRIAGYDVDEETIGQFTGLYDEDGKAVYEGDILRQGDGLTVVNWYDGGFCDLVCNVIISILDIEDSQVIGNIHDNPELLNKKINQ